VSGVIKSSDDNQEYPERGPGRVSVFLFDVPPGGAPGAVTEISNESINLFCSGHAFMSNGRLFFTGGHIAQTSARLGQLYSISALIHGKPTLVCRMTLRAGTGVQLHFRRAIYSLLLAIWTVKAIRIGFLKFDLRPQGSAILPVRCGRWRTIHPFSRRQTAESFVRVQSSNASGLTRAVQVAGAMRPLANSAGANMVRA
jgi:hypothetical protein